MYHRYFIENEEERPLYFTIGVNNGIIRTTQALDREETAWHNITVMAAEVGKFTATADQIRLSAISFSAHPFINMPCIAGPPAIHPPLFVSFLQGDSLNTHGESWNIYMGWHEVLASWQENDPLWVNATVHVCCSKISAELNFIY